LIDDIQGVVGSKENIINISLNQRNNINAQ